MNIEKLSNKLDFDVEAQAKSCDGDCPSGLTMVNNTSVSIGKKNNCHVIITYTSFISKKK